MQPKQEFSTGTGRPLFSIVTPSFNQGRYIGRTIESVLSQGIADLEYVVIDGGSTDNTVALLRDYDGRIQWVSEKDRGQAHAVNKGIERTTGEFIGWLNSDDVYAPNALNAVREYFLRNPETDIVYGRGNHIDENDQYIEDYPAQSWEPDKLPQRCFICQPTVFFRRRVFCKLGFLNENLHFSMDYELWLRAAKLGIAAGWIDAVLAGSRLHDQTKTLGARAKAHSEINDMLAAQIGRVPASWLLNYASVVSKLDQREGRKTLWRYPYFVFAFIWAVFHWRCPLNGAFVIDLAQAIASKSRAISRGRQGSSSVATTQQLPVGISQNSIYRNQNDKQSAA